MDLISLIRDNQQATVLPCHKVTVLTAVNHFIGKILSHATTNQIRDIAAGATLWIWDFLKMKN